MDDRQQQIQMGAGLQESRLNTDLIAFLEKWGTWILTVVLVLVAGYVGYAKYKEYHLAKHDDAFDQYASARGVMSADGVLNGSPDNLLRIASEHGTRGAVAHLARLDAAEIKLGAARRGLRLGTDLGAIKPEDALTPEETAVLAKEASELFAQVKASTSGDKSLSVLNLRANWGLVASALSAGDIESARKTLTEIETLAVKDGFTEQAEQAKKRIATLDALTTPPVLLSDADLPALATAAPTPGAGAPVTITQPDGTKIERMPEGFVPPGFDPTKPGPKIGETFVIPPQPAQPGQTPPAPAPTPEPAPEQPKP